MQSLLEQLHNFFLFFNKIFNFHTFSFLKKEQANAQSSCYIGLKEIWLKIFSLPPLSPWTKLASTRRKGIIGLMEAAYSFFPQPQYLRKKSANGKLHFPDIWNIISKVKATPPQKQGEKKSRHNNRDVGGQKKQLKAAYIKEQSYYLEHLSC